jgi:hypothetical protein
MEKNLGLHSMIKRDLKLQLDLEASMKVLKIVFPQKCKQSMTEIRCQVLARNSHKQGQNMIRMNTLEAN